jgi:hypothetical protein
MVVPTYICNVASTADFPDIMAELDFSIFKIIQEGRKSFSYLLFYSFILDNFNISV